MIIEQNSRKIIARLKKDGFELIRMSGSHHVFKKIGKSIVVVPHPKKDILIKTARSIARQAGWI